MGHFSHSCKLSGLPLTGQTPAVLIVMKLRNHLFDCSEKSLRKYGQSNLISNDGSQIKFNPVWFPLVGKYDEYGGLEEIEEDDNTKILEEYYNLPIQTIANIITSGRKDDGYDSNLKPIKVEPTLPDDIKKDEDWFEYYQRKLNDPMPFGNGFYPDVSGKWQEEGYEGWTIVRDGERIKATKEQYDADFKLIHEQYLRYKEWCKENPDPLDDYGKPNYKERYKELVSYSAMWVHGEFYKRLTEVADSDDYNKLDLGNPELLKTLGFEEVPTDKKKEDDERYNRKFQKDGLVIYSDGNWISLVDEKHGVYTLPDFKKYCKKHGVEIDIDEINKKDRVEQIFDYLIPSMSTVSKRQYNADKLEKALEELGDPDPEDMTDEQRKIIGDLVQENLMADIDNTHHMREAVAMLLLNESRYGISNPLTMPYFEAAKEGKLRDNLVRFWRFDSYMYATGNYYDIIGTAPQDGAHEDVFKMLSIAKDVLEEELVERRQYDDIDEDDEEE